jgi:hypothetical protein
MTNKMMKSRVKRCSESDAVVDEEMAELETYSAPIWEGLAKHIVSINSSS